MRGLPNDVPGIEIRRAESGAIDTLLAIDRDACALFERAGVHVDFGDGHEFVVAERNRWLQCLAAKTTLLAIDRSGEPVGFAAGATADGEGYVEQLSVRTGAMRKGIGAALLRETVKAAKEAGRRAVWLTTYNHLPWNRPFYEHQGFVVAPIESHGADIAKTLAHERKWLPLPHERVAMRMMLR
jgi:GNAT superfamily N-acetyltransferase